MIFISYRISDTGEFVPRLDESLTRAFGPDAVFRDKRTLQGGQDWPAELEQKAKACDAMLVVIGKGWKTAAYDDPAREGHLRLMEPKDWVRREITTALDAGKLVVPVLVNGAKMPHKDWLKNVGLERLAEKQAMQLRTDDYADDVKKLIALLRKNCPTLAAAKPAKPKPAPAETKAAPSPKQWRPAVLYPLQPAPHFAGREDLLKELTAWATDASAAARVFALVAAGGTGKTAVAERALASVAGQNAFGVFVWSFYENPQTEACLRSACTYFTGQEPKETGGLLERLQQALTGAEPHLLILDGLETVQATGATGRPRGELEDPLLKRLLRWLAAGLGTRAKALITSRFPLPDLHDWVGGRFREEHVDDLSSVAAVGVLRGWGVKGTDAQLLGAIRPLQDEQTKQVHALSVSVLGSYVGKLWGGDVTKAPTFNVQSVAGSDPKAAKLTGILTSYAEKLPAAERDLLARLSMFSRGVTVEVIGYLVDAGGEIAGKLIGLNQLRLLQMLEGLRGLGLVFRYDTSEGIAFTAHPFLRQFFETLHGVSNPRLIHEAVRAKLAPSLEERPDKSPTDPKDLDRYERLIEITRLAGHTDQAFELYWYGLGGAENLVVVVGDYARGLRIVSTFAADGTPAKAGFGFTPRHRSALLADWWGYAKYLGDLATARRAAEICADIDAQQADDVNLGIDWQNLTNVELLAGRWPAARVAGATSLRHAELGQAKVRRADSHACLAAAWFGLGRLADARRHFQMATELLGESLNSLPGIWEAESKLATGDRTAARSQSAANQALCQRFHWTSEDARCNSLLGRIALPADAAMARRCLSAARVYASLSGDVEIALRCYHLAAEVGRHERDYPLAATEAMSGIQLADSCGFGHWSILIRLELAKVHLAAGNPQDALEPATKALEMSEHPECQYAWGIADGLHLLGVAHARLGRMDTARDYLRRALEKRTPLEHAELKETEAELARLEGQDRDGL